MLPSDLEHALEELVPSASTTWASAAFGASALALLRAAPRHLDAVDDRQRSMNFGDLHHPSRLDAPTWMRGLLDTADTTEATGLFHLPRSGPPPTPGFRTGTVGTLGIPDEPFVFVSYHRHDERLAGELVAVLGARGIRVWWDRMLEAGEPWRDQLYAALGDGRCRAVALVLTERSALSEWVHAEVSEATRVGRPVVQVMLRRAPPLLPCIQYVDLVGWIGSRADGRVADLIAQVKQAMRA